jgi:hypothetical protein
MAPGSKLELQKLIKTLGNLGLVTAKNQNKTYPQVAGDKILPSVLRAMCFSIEIST